jgi:serine/threonine-protein kinase RsbW
MQQLLEHSFPSDTAQLGPVRHRVRDTLQARGCADEFIETSVLAVDEAVSNVMRHGYGLGNPGKLSLTIDVDGADLVFGLRDFAKSFDPGEQDLPSAGELRGGGYGRRLMHEIMDSVQYSDAVNGKGNLLQMRRRLQLTAREQQEHDDRGN